MRKSFLFLLPLVAVLVALAIPAVAFADSPRVAIDCDLSLAVVDPGELKQAGPVVITTGEQTSGALDCGPVLAGTFSTEHRSVVRFKQDGSFQGNLAGSFSITDGGGSEITSGRFTAKITGQILAEVAPGVFLATVSDEGRWVANGDVKGNGTFSIDLVGILGAPAPFGLSGAGGSMEGTILAL